MSNWSWEQSLGECRADTHGRLSTLRWVSCSPLHTPPPPVSFVLFWFHWTWLLDHWCFVGCAKVYVSRIASFLSIFLLKRWMGAIHLTCLPCCPQSKCTALEPAHWGFQRSSHSAKWSLSMSHRTLPLGKTLLIHFRQQPECQLIATKECMTNFRIKDGSWVFGLSVYEIFFPPVWKILYIPLPFQVSGSWNKPKIKNKIPIWKAKNERALTHSSLPITFPTMLRKTIFQFE